MNEKQQALLRQTLLLGGSPLAYDAHDQELIGNLCVIIRHLQSKNESLEETANDIAGDLAAFRP